MRFPCTDTVNVYCGSKKGAKEDEVSNVSGGGHLQESAPRKALVKCQEASCPPGGLSTPAGIAGLVLHKGRIFHVVVRGKPVLRLQLLHYLHGWGIAKVPALNLHSSGQLRALFLTIQAVNCGLADKWRPSASKSRSCLVACRKATRLHPISSTSVDILVKRLLAVYRCSSCSLEAFRARGWAYICFEEGLALQQLGHVAVVGYSIWPVMRQHDVHWLSQLLQPVSLQLSHVVRTPHGAGCVRRSFKVTLQVKGCH